MKNLKSFILAALFILGVSIVANAQTAVRDYSIQLSQSSVTIAQGKSQTVVVSFVKSKSYAKATANLTASALSNQGITLSFDQSSNVADEARLTIVVDETAVVGSYTFTISSEMARVRKGTILNVKVAEKGTNTSTGN